MTREGRCGIIMKTRVAAGQDCAEAANRLRGDKTNGRETECAGRGRRPGDRGVDRDLSEQGKFTDLYGRTTACRRWTCVASHTIHLILMDVMMPRLDGIKAMLKLREEHNIPIILVSAKSEDTDKIFGLEFGADDYITKPFNPLELIARVKSQLRRLCAARHRRGRGRRVGGAVGGRARPRRAPEAPHRRRRGGQAHPDRIQDHGAAHAQPGAGVLDR